MKKCQTAIILAGGKGTRLGDLTKATPKPLLVIANQPFIFYLLDYLKNQKIQKVIFAVGYLGNQFKELIGDEYNGISIKYSVEHSPLGTGGALNQALELLDEENAFVFNGDTLFKIDLKQIELAHYQSNASLSLALRYVEDTNRYGKITFIDQYVTKLHEKGISGPGYINGGIYILNKSKWPKVKEKEYSFEIDLLPSLISQNKVSFKKFNEYFIDIGVPDDFERGQIELK